MNSHFSFLTIFLLAMGWLSHWLGAATKAGKVAKKAGKPAPALFDYWLADRYTTYLSLIGVVVFYFVVPYLATQWAVVATAIGSTAEDPLNPLAAYLGGVFSPWLADFAGRRITAMIGTDPPPE